MLFVGGNYGQNQNYGAFYFNGNNAASNQNSNIGFRYLAMGMAYLQTSRQAAMRIDIDG